MTVQYVDVGDPEWIGATNIDFPEGIGDQVFELITALDGQAYVAGGAARFLLVPEAPEPGDIDIFLYRESNCFPVVAELGRLGYDYADGPPRCPRYDRENKNELKVQVVTPDENFQGRPSYGVPLELLRGFTFYTEQFALWHGVSGPAGLFSTKGREDTEARILRFNSLANPLLAAYRINKYGQKGYSVGMEEIMKLAESLRSFSADDYVEVVCDALSMQS